MPPRRALIEHSVNGNHSLNAQSIMSDTCVNYHTQQHSLQPSSDIAIESLSITLTCDRRPSHTAAIRVTTPAHNRAALPFFLSPSITTLIMILLMLSWITIMDRLDFVGVGRRDVLVVGSHSPVNLIPTPLSVLFFAVIQIIKRELVSTYSPSLLRPENVAKPKWLGFVLFGTRQSIITTTCDNKWQIWN